MGQYYKVVNVDKKVYLSPWSFDNGAKLMEWSYHRNDLILAMMNLLANEWKGDRVYVVGDYAEADDPNEPCYAALKAVEEEFGLEAGKETLYGFAADNFKDVSALADIEDCGFRYIYNHGTKQYIDLAKCPIEWTWYSKEEKKVYISKVAPLSLLLAMGNDRGGGDYHSGHNGFEYVGSWCDTVREIEITAVEVEGQDYEEFAPDFTENKPMIPYTDEEKAVREEMEKNAELG